MTKTEQLQAAWHTLQCTHDIREMLIEAQARPDEVSAALTRLENESEKLANEERLSKMSAITQQMAMLGITPEDLECFIENSKKYKKPAKKAAGMHCATYMGHEVYKGKPLPKSVTEAGWNRITKIPPEYWTQEFKDHMISIGKYQPE